MRILSLPHEDTEMWEKPGVPDLHRTGGDTHPTAWVRHGVPGLRLYKALGKAV
jgi:hypothetical protein